MKRFIIFASLLMLFACRYRTGSGNLVTETRSPGPFTGLSVSGGFEVELRNAGKEEVVVEADDNIIKYIRTDVSGGQLRIRLEDIEVRKVHLKVFVSAPLINKIKASAASTVDVKDELRTGSNIQFNVSSASEVTAVVDAPEIRGDVSSAGELNLKGRTRDFKADASSGASIHAHDLLSENTDVRASSGATAEVHASLTLDAKASSGANISYRGGATVRKTESSGGQVEKD